MNSDTVSASESEEWTGEERVLAAEERTQAEDLDLAGGEGSETSEGAGKGVGKLDECELLSDSKRDELLSDYSMYQPCGPAVAPTAT